MVGNRIRSDSHVDVGVSQYDAALSMLVLPIAYAVWISSLHRSGSLLEGRLGLGQAHEVKGSHTCNVAISSKATLIKMSVL